MANQKVPQLPVLSAVTGDDLFYVVDVNDTTDDPTGSSKQITRDEILTNVNQIDFSTTASTTAQVGRLHWNNADEVGTLELDLLGGNVQLQIGEENLVRVYNADSVTLSVGTVVYVFGSQGNTLSVKRASASGETTSSRTLGIVRESIDTGQRGFVSVGGLVHGLDTSSYSGGTPLWLSTTLGQITNIPPEAPNHIVLLGFVSRVSATVGSVFVHISNGWELDELHNVIISGVTNGDILAYNSGTTAWENTKTLNGDYRINGSLSATTVSATTFYGNGTNLTGVVKGSGTANYLPRWTGTTGLGNSVIQDDGTNIGIGSTPSADAKLLVFATGVFPYGAWISNQSTSLDSIGLRVTSESALGGSKTGISVEAFAHPTTGTSVGIKSYANNGLLGIPVRGEVQIEEGGGMITGIGGYFNARGTGGYGYPTNSYGLQVIDGTEGLNKVLVSVTADGKTNWSSNLTGLTSVSATTISGGTIYGNGTNLTGVVKGAGTANYLPKWTGTTGQGNSQIQDDGTGVGIGRAPVVGYKLSVNGTVYGNGTGVGTYGVVGQNTGDITGTYVGVYGVGSSVEPYVDSIYVGGKFLANGSAEGLNYAAWLQDGTEGVDKILQSKTSDGKTNWVDPKTIHTAFNYGLANAIMTGNFLT